MRKLTTVRRWPDLVVLGAGGVSAALGLVVLVGWHTHSPTLVQVLPALVPMKYNTALGFLLSGLGLLAIALDRPWGALPGAAWSLLLGALTLIQDVFSLNIGIDELLMEDYIRVETAHPGRLAPNTALCFVLIGLALLLMSNSARRPGRPVVLGIGGSLIAALGVAAFIGYLSGLTPAYGWGYLTPMAVQTAGGIAVLGLGILAFAWGDGRAADRGLPRWLAIPVAIGVVTITLILWQALRAQEHAHISRLIAAETASVKNKIIEQVDTRVEALERMGRRWEALGTPVKEQWASDAWVLVIDYPGVQAVAWVDPSLRVRWIVPRAGNEAAQGLNLALEERARTAMLEARQLRTVTFTRSIEVAQGGTEFRVFVPIFRGETFGGFTLGVFRAQTLLDKLLGDEIAPGYSIAVDDEAEDIYRRSEDDRQHQMGWGQETSISLHGVRWRVRVWPTSRLLANAQSSAPEAVLVIGVVMASLLALTICLAQTARRRRNEVEAINRELQARIIELRSAMEREKELARTDPLTGAMNSRAFGELATAELHRARRYERPFTLAYVDIDDFKAVNDRFGHSTGDTLLRLVAETMKQNSRAVDVIARVGGDEFVILLPETGPGPAQVVSRKLQERLLGVVQQNEWPVTFSIGAITFISPPATVDEMLRLADRLMYSAKKSGKNQIRHEIHKILDELVPIA
jgi:diguanylate cyclase (GGDEF)-like protein